MGLGYSTRNYEKDEKTRRTRTTRTTTKVEKTPVSEEGYRTPTTHKEILQSTIRPRRYHSKLKQHRCRVKHEKNESDVVYHAGCLDRRCGKSF